MVDLSPPVIEFKVLMPRKYLYSGVIIIRDPLSRAVMGTYPFASGGAGRGSAPFGVYDLGEFLDQGTDKARWSVHQEGKPDGEVWDQRLGDERTEIQLHRGWSGNSLGCFAVQVGQKAWKIFVKQINYLLTFNNNLSFDVEGEEDASESITSPKEQARRGAENRPQVYLKQKISHHRGRTRARKGRVHRKGHKN